jgi:O-antigen/teichoic acid export membrane protein
MRSPAVAPQPADRSAARLVAANSAWQVASFAARAVAGLGVAILLARSGGPRPLGVFQFALTLAHMLPFYFGIPPLLAREVARRPDDGRRWIEAGTLIALVAGCLFAGVLTAGTLVVGASQQTVVAVLLAGIGMGFDGVARIQFAAFWAWERMRLEAVITGLQEAAFLVAAATAIWAGLGAEGALVAFGASRALGAGLGWALVSRQLGAPVVPRTDLTFLRGTVRRATPFALDDMLTLTYMRADAVLLGVFKGPVAVGLYQAGTNLVLYFNVLARSINRALYPRMSKAWPARPGDFGRLRDASLRSIGLIAMPIAVASLLLAPRTFDFLYGPRFDRAVLTYQLLVLVIPVRMLGHTFSVALAAADRQTRRTVAVAVVAILNVALNLYFIPRWSYLGAALTTVICETGLLLVFIVLLRQVAGATALLPAVVVPGLATLPMAAVIVLTNSQHLLVSAVAGTVTYALTVLAYALLRTPAGLRAHPAGALLALVRPAR